jgi:MFS family permease
VDTPRVFSPGRRTLPKPAAFWILAVLFLMLFFASAAASPLYPVYQVRFGFSAATLTAVFAVYVLVLLATLLFFGTVSDYLGRLPVIIMALLFSVAGCAVFLAAHDVGALYLARSLQGIATGLASGPIGAALIELQPPGSRAGHGRTRDQASRRPGLTAAQDRRAAPGPVNLCRGRSVFRRDLGPRRAVPVAGTIARRRGDRLD